MRGILLRSTGKSAVAILCAASFLAMSLGAVSRPVAADTWQTWPNRTGEPGTEQIPAADENGTAKAGDAAEKKTAKGRSYGTIGWIALGIAAVIGIGIAAGGGGGEDGGGVVTNPGHQ
jgi:hypothetical protein